MNSAVVASIDQNPVYQTAPDRTGYQWSFTITLNEEADLMRSPGAIDAMNLDGGGSTSFVVDGQTINHPSDAAGPRPIGDSIQIVR